jgi:spermidine synthase
MTASIWEPPKGTYAYLASGNGELSCVEVRHVLAEGQSPFQSYLVLDTVPFGRILVLDNVIQSADLDEHIYHETFVIPPMCAVERPRRVAVLGGGEGAMVREVLRHPTVEAVTMVDIDEEVVAACREHLPTQHAGAFADPRLTLVYDDARSWLEAQHNPDFDVILVDLTEPLAGGPSDKLFTREFYDLCKRSLAPGGVMALQAGSTRLELAWAFARVIRTLEAVFPNVVSYMTWITSFAEPWGFAVAGGDDVAQLSLELIDTRIKARDVEPRYLDGECFEGLQRLPRYLREAYATNHEVATDERPLVFSRK